MGYLRQESFTHGKYYSGYLYNTGMKKFVGKESADDIWLYADKSSETETLAIKWDLYLDGANSAVFEAYDSKQKKNFLNWRELTGACKLYESYDTITMDWEQEEHFKLFVPKYSQCIGTWSYTNNELYLRKNVVNYYFKFLVVKVTEF